jgi:hypothetical protein
MKDTTSCQSGSIYLRICWGDIRSSSALSPTLMTLSKTWQLHSQCIGIYFSKDVWSKMEEEEEEEEDDEENEVRNEEDLVIS